MPRYSGSNKPGDPRGRLRLDRCPRATDQLCIEPISVYLISYTWTRGEFMTNGQKVHNSVLSYWHFLRCQSLSALNVFNVVSLLSVY